MHIAYLSLGSNVDKERNLPACVDLLAQHGRLLAISPVYETGAIGNPDDPSFFNAAVALETELGPAGLKELVLRPVEAQLGRQRSADPNAPRAIDVDISLFDDQVLDLGRRHVPDPEILTYPHIAVPLAAIAPSYRHPETGEALDSIARQVVTQSSQRLERRDDVDIAAPARLAAVLPASARRAADGSLILGGCAAAQLAERLGTPLYVVDAATIDGAIREYQAALQAYPGTAAIAYAAKAWLCTALTSYVDQKGLELDVVSGGELAIALHAGFPAERIHLHGNNKTPSELAQALEAGVGRIVVDHPAELELLDQMARRLGRRQAIWLRINPDVDVDTHGHTRTGHAASKFGLPLAGGAAATTAREALSREGVHLVGLHCHVGSQFRDTQPLVRAVDRLLKLAADLRAELDWTPAELSPGGGWAVPYTAEDTRGLPAIGTYVKEVARAVVDGCAAHSLPWPRLVLEPGRSLVARAGVALYTVGAVKQAGPVTYAFVDGGLADNPRPALYGARYTAVLANRAGGAAPPQLVTVAGPYCETGDVLIHDIELPVLEPGDLLAVPASGAYQLSMSSNYNAARRPAVVWVQHGQAHVVQRRETMADLLARDEVP